MGQPIVVVEKPSVANPGMVRFETNRALTGMSHERYRAGTEVRGHRPPDELARRLLARGGIESVHMNGSVVTVDLAKGSDSAGLVEIIEGLFIHYPPEDEAEMDLAAGAEAADQPDSEGELVEQVAMAEGTAPDPEHASAMPAADASEQTTGEPAGAEGDPEDAGATSSS